MLGFLRRLFAKSSLSLTQKDFEDTLRKGFAGLEAKYLSDPR